MALATSHYGRADPQDLLRVKDVPKGDYELHVWVEGQKQTLPDRLISEVHIAGEVTDLGEFSPVPRIE
jgi:hypothetical protein